MAYSVSRQEEDAALEAVLASRTFAKSPNLARLLRYICGKYFEGRASDLKEYNIGVEALGRPTDFDPSNNSIVRVELHRLREKLRSHYETEGLHDPVIIVLEPGKYGPRFLARSDLPAQIAPAGTAPFDIGVKELEVEAEQPGMPRLPESSPPLPEATSPSLAAKRGGKKWARVVIPMLALALVAVAAVFVRKSGLIRSQPVNRVAPGLEGAGVAASTGSNEEIRILAGSPQSKYIDHEGKVWGPDRFYSGGTAVSGVPQFIDRTKDATLYQNCRSGDFSYDVPLRPGVYELRLYFAETTYGPNTLAGGGESSRIFNVDLNGRRILDAFDPLSDAGANKTADERVFDDVTPTPDGQLHLRFSNLQGPVPPQDGAILNALEIVPGTSRKMRPIRIVAQANSYTDHAGRVWSSDLYASQGRLVTHNRPVEHTADPGLYLGERYGHFSYAIPVASGKYALTLHFAETYYGPQNPGGGGLGNRVFDVYCNGLRILHNFDIIKEAGGPNRALAKTFHGLEPSPQGKLLLTFVPIENYACVCALEVNSEE
jgi:hypothetical protein